MTSTLALSLACFLSLGTAEPAPDPPPTTQNAPAVTRRSMLNVDVYDSGFLGFSDVYVAFAPEAPGACSIVVREAGGEVLKNIGFYAGRFEGWANRNGVFACLQPQRPAEHTFETGDYVVEYNVDGKVATRMPFSVEPHTESDDPFAPASTVRFVGPWQRFAYFTFDEQRDGAQAVELNLWAGASDLGHGESRVTVSAVLERDDEVIARTKRGKGLFLDHVWLKRRDGMLFGEHADGEEQAAPFLTRSEISKDGSYRLTLAREDDGTVLRTYAFTAKGGELVPHPRTELGHEPHADYIAPRVLREGTTTFEFEEAFWIEAPAGE